MNGEYDDDFGARVVEQVDVVDLPDVQVLQREEQRAEPQHARDEEPRQPVRDLLRPARVHARETHPDVDLLLRQLVLHLPSR